MRTSLRPNFKKTSSQTIMQHGKTKTIKQDMRESWFSHILLPVREATCEINEGQAWQSGKENAVFGESGWGCKQRPALKTNREQPARESNYYFYYRRLTSLSHSGTLARGFEWKRRLGRHWERRLVRENCWRWTVWLKTREERKQREHSQRHEAIWPSRTAVITVTEKTFNS